MSFSATHVKATLRGVVGEVLPHLVLVALLQRHDPEIEATRRKIWSPAYSFPSLISHNLTDVSPPPPPVASVLPSGEYAIDSTRPVWPDQVCRSFPVSTSQNLISLSLAPLATVLPSGEKVTESTSPLWPLRICRTFPVLTVQTRTVASSLLLATSLPSLGENTAASRPPSCPFSTSFTLPVLASHSRTV